MRDGPRVTEPAPDGYDATRRAHTGVESFYASTVDYGVSIELTPPSETPHLDPLQAEGAGSLLDRLLEQLDGADAEDGDSQVFVTRYWVGAHPEGAIVLLVLDADSLDVAESAARDIMREILDHSEHLADWTIAKCEVGFNERFVDAGLQAADGPGVPPADPAERARWLAEQNQPAAEPADTDEEIDWRQYVIDHASQLRAFDLDVFDTSDRENDESSGEDADDTAKLAAGALIYASSLVIDELFQDIKTLARTNGAVADSDDVFMVLDDLPERFAQHYDGRFARQFLVATVMITARLTADEWIPPASVAEALALHIVVENAKVLLDSHDLLDDDISLEYLYNGFDDAAYEDVDHELLYRRDLDGFEDDQDITSSFGMSDMRVEAWFDPIADSDATVHPFSVHVEAPKAEPANGSDG
ncbi:hypothetical protein AB0M02_18060 [Actinoplanes sp. NPDC051861]|uniref:hypothetical protein n=1 Tax=Actinoplanes sp. NPDC051861 TaxID=3155170 RepID=UPI003447F961